MSRDNPNGGLKEFSRQDLRQLVRLQLQALLEQGNLAGAKTLLGPVQPIDIAEAIEGLPDTMHALVFRLLSKAEAIEVYECLDSSVQQSLIEEFKRQDLLEIVDKMSPDDRARLFDELPAKVVTRLLEQLSLSERKATALLLGYSPNTAGRIMTPEYISLKEGFTVQEALERIRRLASITETVYYLYVTDAARRLTGILSLRDLVVSQPSQTIGEVMTRESVSVHTDTDQEEVARTIQRYDFLAVPVVDSEERLVGIVTVDDVIDILEEEATEDIYTLGGLQSGGDNYFQTNLLTVTRRRITWLLVLFLTNTVTATIIQSYGGVIGKVEAVVGQAGVLAAFIPLLTGTGGNVGAQSSTVVIRGLNTEELQAKGSLKVIGREALAGAILGLSLSVVTMLWALFFLGQTLPISLAVGISLFAIAVLASVSGASLPFLFRTLGFDPALMSAPFITTAVDVLGVLIYFNLVRVIMQL